MRYQILVYDAPEKLEAGVNELLGQGWQLAGGLAVAATESVTTSPRDGCQDVHAETWFCQALVNP